MERVRTSIICSLGALVVLAALWGCNANIDDGSKSDSVLIVDSVTPSSVQADTSSSSDPNAVSPTPPADDTITIEVRNMNRTQTGASIFGDIILDSMVMQCANHTLMQDQLDPLAPITSTASLTIPADSSASLSVTVAMGAYKLNHPELTGQSDMCSIIFHGEDLGGHPIISKRAVFGISFVDIP